MTSPSSDTENLQKILAQRSELSRRKAGDAIKAGRVILNGKTAQLGDRFATGDELLLDNKALAARAMTTIMLNKPVGYECSRKPHGANPSVYELLPPEFQQLNNVGRLDVESSGLLLFTNDGNLTQALTHPSHQKQKVYRVTLDKPLTPEHVKTITTGGVSLDDGPSVMKLKGSDKNWQVVLTEGRNRQIRRTFARLDYEVRSLHRTQTGEYHLGDLPPGKIETI